MQQSERAGLLYALAGFCLLSIGDAVVKWIDGAWAPTAIAFWRYALGAILLAALLVKREGLQPLLSWPRPGMQFLRGLTVSVAAVSFFIGVLLMPLTEAVSISFTQPMFTALLAVMFLGERLRWQTVAATLLAFAGVLIVLRPNFASIGLAALLPMLTAFAMAMLVTSNRASLGAASALAMQVYISIAASLLLLLATLAGHASGAAQFQLGWPGWAVFGAVSCIAVTASLAHWLIYLGTTNAGAATVGPMTYGQLLSASLLGWLFFDELPDGMAMLGAVCIIAAGLWIWSLGRPRRGAGSPRP